MAITNANMFSSFLPECSDPLLQLLVAIVDQRPRGLQKIAPSYYSYLSSLLATNESKSLDRNLVFAAIRAPLVNQSC